MKILRYTENQLIIKNKPNNLILLTRLLGLLFSSYCIFIGMVNSFVLLLLGFIVLIISFSIPGLNTLYFDKKKDTFTRIKSGLMGTPFLEKVEPYHISNLISFEMEKEKQSVEISETALNISPDNLTLFQFGEVKSYPDMTYEPFLETREGQKISLLRKSRNQKLAQFYLDTISKFLSGLQL